MGGRGLGPAPRRCGTTGDESGGRMKHLLVRMTQFMKRPESRLAAGALLLMAAVAMLINVTLVSCEQTGRSTPGLGEGPIATPAPIPGPGETPDGGGATGPAAGAGFAASRVTREPVMRVRLLAAVDRVTVSARGGAVQVSPLSGESVAAVAASGPGIALRGPVEVRRQGTKWVAGGGTLPLVGAGGGLVISAAGGNADEVTINGVGYPGRMVLWPRSDAARAGAFDVIEHVGLETYLPGVVAKEMYAGWPAAAYQVQAVCARTYAIHELLRVGGRGAYDVEAGERDQAYLGATTNRAAADAVRATRGWVLTDRADGEGDILRAYYSSTCGGRMASAADTWPTSAGFEFNLAAPIQARPGGREWACQSAPMSRWTITRDRQELVARLRTFGERQRAMVRQIKDLWAIDVLSTNVDGRPNAFKIIEPGGKWYRLSGEQLRLALNTNVTPAAPGDAAGELLTSIEPAPATIGFAGEAAESAVAGPPPAAPAPRPVVIPPIDRKSRVPSSDLAVTGPRGSSVVTITGRGFGHGVGMCQFCAKAFAERGEDWRTMVQRFYPGAGVRRAY